jgi:hypothetical protein
MVAKIKIKKFNITFVFRHRWDEKNKSRFGSDFREYGLGIWFRPTKIVGRTNVQNHKEWSKNLVNDYMIGVDLIVCKAWVSFNYNGFEF